MQRGGVVVVVVVSGGAGGGGGRGSGKRKKGNAFKCVNDNILKIDCSHRRSVTRGGGGRNKSKWTLPK